MPQDRRDLRALIAHARAHPDRLRRYARRLARDGALLVRARGDHVRYYRAVMKSDTARDPETAVGGSGHERWLALGKLQFDYLVAHGLRPGHRMLDIGCGNLRAGWRFADYLDPGNYYGIDISPDILLVATETVAGYGLQDKLPHLTLVRDLRLTFLPGEHFDVVHAHSVFSHSPLPVIEECFAHVGRVMRRDAIFDFTFDRTTGREYSVLREDFYYRTETLLAAAGRHGLSGELMADWEANPHRQSKIRLRRRDEGGATSPPGPSPI